MGWSIRLPNGSIKYKSGTWTLVQELSSNFREFYNLVNALEEAGSAGILDGCEMFMFTDNSTAERCFFNGTSSTEALFNLVVRL